MSHPSRAKGDRFERDCVHRLNEHGILTARVPLSGSAGGEHTDDLTIEVCGLKWRAECKTRKRAWTDLFGWLSRKDRRPPDMLLIKADRTDTLVVLTLEQFALIAKGIL